MPPIPHTPPTLDRQKALAQYDKRAQVYDLELLAFEPIRHSAIAQLKLAPGDAVLDLGCGTGLSFAPIQQAIGAQGRIVGVEQCPEMLELARARLTRHHWGNVTLLNTPVEEANLPGTANAALFHFTHDILRNPDAIRNVLKHLKPGARVVAAGLQWASPWAWATNCFVALAAMHSVSSLNGLDQPWSLLARELGGMDVSSTPWSGIYIATGQVPL